MGDNKSLHAAAPEDGVQSLTCPHSSKTWRRRCTKHIHPTLDKVITQWTEIPGWTYAEQCLGRCMGDNKSSHAAAPRDGVQSLTCPHSSKTWRRRCTNNIQWFEIPGWTYAEQCLGQPSQPNGEDMFVIQILEARLEPYQVTE